MTSSAPGHPGPLDASAPLVIALDGGTTNTRARLVDAGTHQVLATARRAVGLRDAASATSGAPSPLALAVAACLAELETHPRLAGWTVPIVASGMITADGGLCPVPHVLAPAGRQALAAGMLQRTLPELGGRTVHFIPGVRTPAAEGPDGWTLADVMRGEECEALGACRLLGEPSEPWVFLSPGSHTKLVALDAQGQITASFTTLAGELCAAVAGHTLIAASLPPDWPEALDPEAIEAGRRLADQAGLGRAGFAVRLAALTGSLTADQRAAFWLGAVVADDVRSLSAHPLLAGSVPVVVGGRQPQRGLYGRWLAQRHGGPVRALDDDQAERASALGALGVAGF